MQEALGFLTRHFLTNIKDFLCSSFIFQNVVVKNVVENVFFQNGGQVVVVKIHLILFS